MSVYVNDVPVGEVDCYFWRTTPASYLGKEAANGQRSFTQVWKRNDFKDKMDGRRRIQD